MSTKLHAFMTGYLSKQADANDTSSENRAGYSPSLLKNTASIMAPSLATNAGIRSYIRRAEIFGDGSMGLESLRLTKYNPLKASYESLMGKPAPDLNFTKVLPGAGYISPDGWIARIIKRNKLPYATGVLVPQTSPPGTVNGVIQPRRVQNVHAGVLAHELGHASRGRLVGSLNALGKPALLAGAVGAATLNDEEAAKKSMLAGTVGGLATALTEIDASRQGSKILRHAKTLPNYKYMTGGFKRGFRGSPYVGVPTYLLSALLPLATFYTKKSLGGYRPKPAESTQA
jgi:hypothetical protein